jgi:hypothetical protein
VIVCHLKLLESRSTHLRITIGAYHVAGAAVAARALVLLPFEPFDDYPAAELFDLTARQRATTGAAVGRFGVVADFAARRIRAPVRF